MDEKLGTQDLTQSAPQGARPARRVRLDLRTVEQSDVSEAPFPAPRLYHWKPVQEEYDAPPPSFSIIVTQDVLKRVNEHVSQNTSIEVGGFLLGNRYVCPNTKMSYIKIDNYSEAQFTSADDVSLHIDNMTWMHLHDELDGKHQGKKLMGWYHSHPGHTVFLSSMDLNVHELGFTEEWMVALVIDPQHVTGGFFCQRGGSLHPHALVDFYEQKGINSDETCMPWVNYKCYDGINNEPLPPPPLAAPSNQLVPGQQQQLIQAPTKQPGQEDPEGKTQEQPLPPGLFTLRNVVVALLSFAIVAVLVGRLVGSNRGQSNANLANADIGNENTGVTQPAKTDPGGPAPSPASVASTIKPIGQNAHCTPKYVCTVKVYFGERPPELIAAVGDDKYSVKLEKEDDVDFVSLDISNTKPIQVLKKMPGANGTGQLPITFINRRDENDRQEYVVSLDKGKLFEPPKRVEVIVPQRPRPGPTSKRERLVINRNDTIGKPSKVIKPCRGSRCD